jgi:lactam utilization protein B
MKIDLNCDMGEGFGAYSIGCDDEVMPHITSANVACGFHASDPLTMWKTVKLAKANGVAVGAHPSYPDLVGFGRRNLDASPDEVHTDVLYQIGALWALCRREGVRLQHVKPHGALYNTAAVNTAVASAIAQAIQAVDPELIMVCLSNSKMVEAAKAAGIRCVEEVFADRAYTREIRRIRARLEAEQARLLTARERHDDRRDAPARRGHELSRSSTNSSRTAAPTSAWPSRRIAGRRRGHRLRPHRRPPGLRVRAGLHRLRRLALETYAQKICKVMDLAP